MLLIGLDAASQAKNFGYAIGELRAGRIAVEEAGMLETRQDSDALKNQVAPRLRRAERALVAIDAPLGWPTALTEALAKHQAGERMEGEQSSLFSRETDRIITSEIGKRPLEVGADKIARAAHTALEVLARLRRLSEKAIPLAWTRDFKGDAVIEVYPSATLKARGLKDSSYKKHNQKAARSAIARGLRNEIPSLETYLDARADLFDACLCLVAAKDFLESETVQPGDRDLARREGWIWVKAPHR